MAHYILDIESNGLLSDMIDFSSIPYKLKPEARLWCVVIRNVETDEIKVAKKEEITKEWMKEALSDCTHLVGHNVIKFDFIVLKLFGVLDYEVGYPGKSDLLFGNPIEIVDTLILSRLFNPDRHGGHSLESWGERTGNEKTDFRKACIEAGIIEHKDRRGAEFSVFSDIMVDYCITPDHRLLGEDLRWQPAREFKIGDKILGFDENSQEGKMGRRFRTSEIQFISYENRPVYEVFLNSGNKIKTTAEHRWLCSKSNHRGVTYKWVETRNLQTSKSYGENCSKIPKLFNIWEEDMSKDAGWISGMFDGEGHSSKSRFCLSVAQRPTKTLEKLEKILNDKYKGKVSRRYVKKDSDCVTLKLLGCAAEKLQFLGEIRPERMISTFEFENLGRVEARLGVEKVIDVVYIGEEEIIKMQTSTGTFICEGYPMHNCTQDTSSNTDAYKVLYDEWQKYEKWDSAIKMENKLADLAVRRESFGFWFDKELAVKCLADLGEKMEKLKNRVNPNLPPKPMNQGELKNYTLPKNQFKKDGSPSSHLLKFVEKTGSKLILKDDVAYIVYKEQEYRLPYEEPLESTLPADISNLDHVKMHLMFLGWVPTEWRERDLTKDSKKQNIPYEKRVQALDRWFKETMEGKYKQGRLDFLGYSEDEVYDKLFSQLKQDRPVRIPTSPTVRVGVEKELCPNLLKLGEKVDFAKDFALFLTYKHRKSSIAGGDIEDMDFDLEYPNSGFLSMYREVDGRVATPSIEIGASTNRYRHIGICNIARASSIYGKEMRSLFGSGPDGVQYGYDFASLENRIQGSYVFKYRSGPELAETLIAEKPNDLHTITGQKLGISRTDAKSVVYALLYGASANKISKMLAIPVAEAKVICDGFWEGVPALKELKDNLERHWEQNDKKWIQGIDGRKIMTRSKHSLLNSLFQSGGVIAAKYVNVLSMQLLEEKGHKIDCFSSQLTVTEMIAYHDECQLFAKANLFEFKKFKDEAEAQAFIDGWQGEQLSAIAEGNDNFYVVLPNEISLCIGQAIEITQEKLKLSVPLGFEYIVHKNWYGCH